MLGYFYFWFCHVELNWIKLVMRWQEVISFLILTSSDRQKCRLASPSTNRVSSGTSITAWVTGVRREYGQRWPGKCHSAVVETIDVEGSKLSIDGFLPEYPCCRWKPADWAAEIHVLSGLCTVCRSTRGSDCGNTYGRNGSEVKRL